MICDRSGSCVACAVRNKRPPQIWRKKKGFESAKENLDIVIASSQYMKNALANEFKEIILVLPNFVPKPPETITSSGISNYYLCAGVMEEHKGVLDLLHAWFGMRCYKGTESGLVFAGDGSLKGYLKEKVKEYVDCGINNLFVLGKCDSGRLYNLYYGAKALIVPSRCPDNNPLVALEALSVGTPVISSNVGGLPEIVDLQGEGFRSDRVNLVNLISHFDKHPGMSRDFLRKIYLDNFSTDKYIKNYLDAIGAKLNKK
jgi:glycosyltransferase involved in cell wall biosynthesis